MRFCIQLVEDAFLYRLAPELSLQLAYKYRMASYNLILFSYAHRLYLNILTPSDIANRLDQLPKINKSKLAKGKFLINILRTMSTVSTNDDQFQTLNEQKQTSIDRILSHTTNDERLISIINTLLRISRLFRCDSSNLLRVNVNTDEWELLKRILSYPSSSFPTKIKLAEYFSKQLKLSNQQLVELIVNETDHTLKRSQEYNGSDDRHCWPFDPANIESFRQFMGILYDKNYDAIGKELLERSKQYEEAFLASNYQGLFYLLYK